MWYLRIGERMKRLSVTPVCDNMVENKGDVDAYTSDSLNLAITISWYLIEAYRVFLEPILCQLGLVTPGFGDPTYGRASLPRSADEQRYIYDNPRVTVEPRTIHLTEEALRKGKSWDRPEYSFVAYSTWRIDEAWEREKREGLSRQCERLGRLMCSSPPHHR